ncbi:hypothetical protein MMC25_003320 [Agyrium rufum]|nr:hypothetical protein [Agyrium rufum]
MTIPCSIFTQPYQFSRERSQYTPVTTRNNIKRRLSSTDPQHRSEPGPEAFERSREVSELDRGVGGDKRNNADLERPQQPLQRPHLQRLRSASTPAALTTVFTSAPPPPPLVDVVDYFTGAPPSAVTVCQDTFQPPPAKKRKLARTKANFHISDLPTGFSLVQPPLPQSPLFFSHRKRQRPLPPLPAVSFESRLTMMNHAHKDDVPAIRTVKLARGISHSMKAGSYSASQGSRKAYSEGPIPRFPISPDDSDTPDRITALNAIGLTELLDQDDRPTFVIDIADEFNQLPGSLRVLFANTSLHSINGLFEMVSGRLSDHTNLSSIFGDFKIWVMSFVQSNRSMDIVLPSFTFSGFSWSCSTLQKRFRSISGIPLPSSMVSSNPPSVGVPLTNLLINSRMAGDVRRSIWSESSIQENESIDYFGNTGATVKSVEDVSPATQQIPRVNEEPAARILTARHRSSEAALSGAEAKSNPTEREQSPLGTRVLEAQVLAAAAGNVDEFHSPPSEKGFFDWTRIPVTPLMPRHIRFARSIKWEHTSLGPIEDWPVELRGVANLVMASPHPAAMYWGDDLIAIYNEAYIMLAGQKHPELMGQSYQEAWKEIWDDVKWAFDEARTTGQATMKDDDCLFMKRNGFLEETYFSWSIIPLIGGDGSVQGMYNPAFEKTRRKVAERRMLTLREVGEMTATAREVKGFWPQVLKGLESNEYDTPFVMMYSVLDDLDSDESSICSASNAGLRQCLLEGALGVPQGHTAAPMSTDLRASVEGFTPYFREAMMTDRPLLLQTEDSTLDPNLIEGIARRGFDDPCRAVVITAIHPTTGDSILGFLVIGINPRRPYDDDYRLFVQLLSRQLTTSMASVVLFEEEIRRGQKAAKLAAQDRIELSEQLAARTQEVAESETKFTRMAEFAPVGMFIANSHGKLTYSNDTWYEISRHPKELNSTDNWMDSIKDEDRGMVLDMWHRLIKDKIPMTNVEFRFKTPWTRRDDVLEDTWVLANAYPERNIDGSLKSVFGSITNISQQKWAANLEKRRTEEAIELKRQQENFIDITSHEIRNPLSAILQCADEIASSLSEIKADIDNQVPQDLLESNINAAQTIILCANHQKRIVDDVLTLSKLDSALLLVTPIDTQPTVVVQRALKMFESEVLTADIKMEYKVDKSISRLKVDWVKLDPSRLLQVLINLTTNAIKFTTTQDQRTIIVTLSATSERPSRDENNPYRVTFFPSRSNRKNMANSLDWGDGDDIFLHFAVQDTGRGLSDSEKKLLFMRFSQASPRTHVQYGGSGLGLFISRELVELQGGEIGVASEAGMGSTFAFYVKTRKSSAPKEVLHQLPMGSGLRRQQSSDASKAAAKTIADLGAEPAAGLIRPEDFKVLIVEDNLVNQRVLQRQLRNIGCKVYVANHGIECIDQLKESTYWLGHSKNATEISVILMDLEMPLMDGLTCTRKIREYQKQGQLVRHIPIIAVTANARSEQIDTALDAGMDDVVSKPFRIPELIPKIESLVKAFHT